MNDNLTWLHISDIHIGSDYVLEQEIVLSSLTESFKPGGALSQYLPDIIFCTGDIANKGKVEEYDTAEKYLRDLCAVSRIEPSSVFLVPGNHDIDRTNVPRFSRIELKSTNAVNDFFLDKKNPDRKFAFTALQNYSTFYKRFSNESFDFENPYNVRIVQIKGLTLGIVELNSALLSGYDDVQGKLIIGECVVRQAIRDLNKNKEIDISFFLVHHPLDWLSNFEKYNIQSLIRENCHVLLHGDRHEANPYSVLAGEGKHVVNEVGATFQGREYKNSAYIVRVTKGTAKIIPISFVNRGKGFWTIDSTILGKKVTFKLSVNKKEKDKSSTILIPYAFCNKLIETVRYVDIFRYLGTNQKIRSNIEDVFVHQYVRCLNVQEDRSVSNTQLKGVINIFKTNPFIVLIGSPGSGKTTTMRYISYLLLESYRDKESSCKKLDLPGEVPFPIFLRLRELLQFLGDISSINVTTLIDLIIKWSSENFWAVTDRKLRTLFKERKLCILLDGLDEIEDKKSRRKITQIINKASGYYNDIEGPGRIIMTSRPYAYDDECRLDIPFIEVAIEDMSRDQIERFTELWCRAVHYVPGFAMLHDFPKVENEYLSLKNVLWANEQLRILTKTPVLLTIIATVHHRLGHLSGSKGDLYEETVNILLSRFVDHPKWKPQDVKEILSDIAYKYFLSLGTHSSGDFFDRSNIIEIVTNSLKAKSSIAKYNENTSYFKDEALEFLDQQELLGGLLLARNTRDFAFVHKSFLEFLAGWKLASQEDVKTAEVFIQKIEDLNCREILIFAVDIIKRQGVNRLARIYHDIHALQASKLDKVDILLYAMKVFIELKPDSMPKVILDDIILQKNELLSIAENRSTPVFRRVLAVASLGWGGCDKRFQGDEITTVLVPSGEFLSGAPEATALNFELPEQVIFLPDFKISAFPITCSQFSDFLSSRDFQNPDFWPDGYVHHREEIISYDTEMPLRSNYPIAYVNWFEASAFSSWLNFKYPLDNGWRWRLPTQYEWEKAARGGFSIENELNSINNRTYPWGMETNVGYADTWEVIRFQTGPLPVGCFPEGIGPYKTFDQSGNVWEWCEDWYEPDTGSNKDQKMPRKAKIVKGGSWRGTIDIARISYRDWVYPERRLDDVGFRVVCSK